jgi:hypothetical protein
MMKMRGKILIAKNAMESENSAHFIVKKCPNTLCGSLPYFIIL